MAGEDAQWHASQVSGQEGPAAIRFNVPPLITDMAAPNERTAMLNKMRRKTSGLRIVKNDNIARANQPAEFVGVLF
jgi:hypothetical protein